MMNPEELRQKQIELNKKALNFMLKHIESIHDMDAVSDAIGSILKTYRLALDSFETDMNLCLFQNGIDLPGEE